MATGISKNKWDGHHKIISRENLVNIDAEYVIEYKGKIDKRVLLKAKPESNYTITIFNNSSNSLYFGDNIDVLKHLIHSQKLNGKVKLIYIDPPYGTNSVFHSRDNKNSYSDTLVGAKYLEFLRRRLILLQELLSNGGSIYLHLDNNMVFQAKLLLDEVFGAKNFRGFITRKKCSNKNSTRKTYGNISDYILFYSKTDKYTWNRAVEPWSEEKIKKEYSNIDPITKRRFKKVPIHAPGIRNGETGKEWRGMLPPEGKHWQYTPAKLEELDKNGEIYWSANGNPRRKVFLDTSEGIPVQDIWLELQDSLNQNIKITGYPTEKNPDLLKRIIKSSSNENDIVLDCFAGSGTTLGVAKELNRNWVGIDNSYEAIDHIMKRFIEGTKEMGDYVEKKNNDSIVLTLFESLSQYNITRKLDFNFFVDNDYLDIANELIKKWNISKVETYNHKIAQDYLKQNDSILKNVINEIGECRLVKQKTDFLFLVEAIISQQLSLKASESIIKKVKIYFDGQITPEKIQMTADAKLESFGISKRKLSYLKDLSNKIIENEISLDRLSELSNEEIIYTLSSVKGIGLWTSKMYLIFVLSREDVLPFEDTAFRNSYLKIYNSKEEEYKSKIEEQRIKWHPYESIASWYIWASNRG